MLDLYPSFSQGRLLHSLVLSLIPSGVGSVEVGGLPLEIDSVAKLSFSGGNQRIKEEKFMYTWA